MSWIQPLYVHVYVVVMGQRYQDLAKEYMKATLIFVG